MNNRLFDFTEDEKRTVNRIGADTGCHTCGTKDPGTISGHFICDLQPPSELNWQSNPQRIYPQCLFCKKMQGAAIRNFLLNGKSLLPSDTPSCVMFIADALTDSSAIIPERGRNVWSTPKCVAIGLKSYMDGVTNARVEIIELAGQLEFDGMIDTPSKQSSCTLWSAKYRGAR